MVIKTQDFRQFKNKAQLTIWLVDNKRIANKSFSSTWITNNVPKESKYQSDILKYINTQLVGLSAYAWKNQSGKYQNAGIPDIIACINGKFFAFEVKRPFIGRVTEIQQNTIDRINAAGGHAYVVTYVEDVKDVLLKVFGMLENEIV